MSVHPFRPKTINPTALHAARQQALTGTAIGGVEQIDPTDIPQQLAEWLPGMGDSICTALRKIAAEPTIEACEQTSAQLHHVVVHLLWISQGLAKQRTRAEDPKPCA